jgi:3-oxoisoapionate kinase
MEHGVLLAYYGDDFTGSTDVMEAFTAAGISTVLFLDTPNDMDLKRFAHMRCIGLAGQSRGKSPQWMDQHLPPAFKRLLAFGAPILHYKICSTFDSSPSIGSIGKAIDIGTSLVNALWSPMIVGAPRLKRYQIFGQLFAAANDSVYRIDRHPTMSQHPVTPMNEADLGVHLGKQTARQIRLINVVELAHGHGQTAVQAQLSSDQAVVMIDVMDDASQREAGRLVWENRGSGIFTASSSGLQYALASYWQSIGRLAPPTPLPSSEPVNSIAVVSGSCSPMSAQQIRWAQANGFFTERLHLNAALTDQHSEAEIARLVRASLEALARGQSPILYSALGPTDPAVLNFDQTAEQAGLSRQEAAARVGHTLARVMRAILDSSAVTRIVVAGGDSSGAVASHLGIRALTVEAGLAPGVPLCKAWSDQPQRDGLSIALKGGQMGGEDFYGLVLGAPT